MYSIAPGSSWVAWPKVSPQARVRLFCLPYAGGGTAVFYKWPAYLPAEIEVCPIRLPGREGRRNEVAYTELPPLVEALAEVVRAHCDIPFALFGHSMGALVAFELARELRRQNGPGPVHLFVAAHRAPHLPDRDPPVHYLPELQLLEALRHLDGTPEVLLQNVEMRMLFLPVLRADFAVCENYRYAPEPPLECSMSAFGSAKDWKVPLTQLAAWRGHTRGPFALRIMPGNHFFVHTERVRLLQAISQDLAEVMQRG